MRDSSHLVFQGPAWECSNSEGMELFGLTVGNGKDMSCNTLAPEAGDSQNALQWNLLESNAPNEACPIYFFVKQLKHFCPQWSCALHSLCFCCLYGLSVQGVSQWPMRIAVTWCKKFCFYR